MNNPNVAIPELASMRPSDQAEAVQVPLKFVQGFCTLAHNYSLKAVPPDYYSGTEGDAFSSAYRRCGEDLAKLRALIPAATDTPPGPREQEVPKWIDDPHDINHGQMLNPAWLKLHDLTPAQAAASREEAAASAEAPSEKQKKLLDLADRIDHEQLWRWAGMDHHKMTPEQRDRMNAGVALRRYARLWAPGHWVVFPPVGPVSFSASTLGKAVEMATRDDARRSDAGTRRAAAAPEPDDTPLETGEGDAR